MDDLKKVLVDFLTNNNQNHTFIIGQYYQACAIFIVGYLLNTQKFLKYRITTGRSMVTLIDTKLKIKFYINQNNGIFNFQLFNQQLLYFNISIDPKIFLKTNVFIISKQCTFTGKECLCIRKKQLFFKVFIKNNNVQIEYFKYIKPNTLLFPGMALIGICPKKLQNVGLSGYII